VEPELFANLIDNVCENFMNPYENWEKLFKIAKQSKLPLVIHPELPQSQEKLDSQWNNGLAIAEIEKSPNPHLFAHNVQHSVYSNEIGNIQMITCFIRKFFPNPLDAPQLHFVHVSHPDAVEVLNQVLKVPGYPVSIEVSPHHALLNFMMKFSQESYAKVLVPLRKIETQKELKALVQKGAIDSIGTDHAPHTLEEKNAEFENAPSGFPYIDFASRILLTEVFNNELELSKFVYYYSTKPAEIFHISEKGLIKEGYDADLVIIEEVESYPIRGADMLSKQKWTPWEGREITAKIKEVYLGGQLAFDYATGLKDPCGKILTKMK
jgi:hypothetical protein